MDYSTANHLQALRYLACRPLGACQRPDDVPLIVAEFISHELGPLFEGLNDGQRNASNRNPHFRNYPANRTYSGHRGIDVFDPERSSRPARRGEVREVGLDQYDEMRRHGQMG